ncbi:MAG TPA: YfhO family protein [Terriglobia bacterium]
MPEPELTVKDSLRSTQDGRPVAPPRRVFWLITRADAAPLALLAGILILLFRRVLFAGQMFFYRDVFSYTYPRAQFIHAVARTGHLPYWNPYFSFGEPVLANPNFLFFYPTTLLIILLPVGLAYGLHYILHFGWVALGTYLLARRWEQSRTAAFFAAATFAFSGPVLSLGNLYNQAAAAAWIPWALLVTDYAVRHRSRRPWILLSVVLALQFIGAEPFTLLATVALAFAYAVFDALGTRDHLRQRIIRLVLAFAAVGLLMLGLSAVGLLPSLDILHRARRGTTGLPYGETVYWSLHPLTFLDLLLPGFFGSVFDSSTSWTYVLAGRNQPYYVSVFVGFVPIFFAWIGWSEGRDRRRNFLAVAAVILLLLACGRYTPLFAEAYLLFPPLALVRFPAKLLVPAIGLLAILAGWGVDVIRRAGDGSSGGTVQWRMRTLSPLIALGSVAALIWVLAATAPQLIDRGSRAILLATNQLFERSPADQLRASDLQAAMNYALSMIKLQFPGLAGFFLGGAIWLVALKQGRRWARRGLGVVIALGIAQAVWVNDSDNPTVPRSFYTYRPPVVEQPPHPSGPYRFAYIQRDPQSSISESQALLNFDSIPEARGFSAAAQISFRDRLLLNRGAMLSGIEMAENLDMEGSLPPAYYEFWIHEIKQESDQARADCLLGRANVKYIVRQNRRPSATTREVGPVFNGSPDPSYLYQDLCFMPRAYAVGNAVESINSAGTLSKLSDPGFDARHTVILEATPPPLSPGVSNPAQDAGEVTITARDPNTVTLRAEMQRPGYVILLDRWDPGWQATVDGRAAPVLIADHMFRAVETGPGTHQIQFRYRQRGLAAGVAVSLITMIALAFAWSKQT